MEFKPKSFVKKIATVVRYGDTRLLEIFMGIFFLMWGMYVSVIPNSFSSSAIFDYISQLTPEWGLGVFLVIIGVLILSLSVCDKVRMHRMFLLVGHGAWMFMAIFALLGDRSSPAVATYSFVAMTMFYLYWRSP